MTDSKRTELTLRAKEIIHGSHLSTADKTLLEGRVLFIADSMLEMFVQVCDEDPFGVDAVVKSLKKKLEAGGNLKSIHEIIKQERREIEESLAIG
ncbi:MAG: hypothetical protein UY04_C0015G0037 [Parcubacteria group bacterium GW2011_GWA2_47_7]|nr:MAG: hypothetical protein UY04_C0015G0037 [Parcubacteria group bacterium GW2011_GWA2_47_7]